jgi:predicted metal-binding membrane protein
MTDLVWIGAATLFLTLEKLPALGRPLTRPAGYLMILAAGVLVARALTLS